MNKYIPKHSWLEFHGSLIGYDVYLGDIAVYNKQEKWFLFWTENDIELDRIVNRSSSKFIIVRRDSWHEEFGGLKEGVVG